MSRFVHCLNIVLGNEGGYSDHPRDRGGATNFGVTQRTYDAYRADRGLEPRPVKEITRQEVEEIYKEYWTAARCGALPEPLDCAVFDCAVNSGVKRAIRLLQRVLGVTEDGVIGRETMAALHEDVLARGVDEVVEDYLRERERFYHDIVRKDATQRVFLHGWLNRVDRLREILV